MASSSKQKSVAHDMVNYEDNSTLRMLSSISVEQVLKAFRKLIVGVILVDAILR